jgi:hypothetical protein
VKERLCYEREVDGKEKERSALMASGPNATLAIPNLSLGKYERLLSLFLCGLILY